MVWAKRSTIAFGAQRLAHDKKRGSRSCPFPLFFIPHCTQV